MHPRIVVLLLLLALPGVASAWWNDDWPYRKKLSFDTTPTGADLSETLTDVPVLIRLGTAEFADFFYLKENLEDLRFIAGDDQTPLKHYVEHFDLLNQLLYIWVRVPQLDANRNTQSIWMYYGNQQATAAGDPTGVLDVDVAANLDFSAVEEGLPQDRSGYANHAVAFTAGLESASLIAGGLRLDGSGAVALPAVPALRLLPDPGFTVSAWVRPEGPQEQGVIYSQGDEAVRVELLVDQSALIARLTTPEGVIETPRTAPLTLDVWQHVALAVSPAGMSVYVDGAELAAVAAAVPEIAGAPVVGAPGLPGATGLVGQLDQLQVSSTARDAGYLQLAARNQGREERLVYPGPEEQLGGAVSRSYFLSILQRVEIEGRIIILLLLLMAAVSWVVMFGKAFVIARIRKDNRAFAREFRELAPGQADALDQASGEDDRELEDSAFLQAMFGRHDHFQSSSLYRIYHAGVQSLNAKLARSAGAAATTGLTPQAVQAIRAIMDGQLVREVQRLNNQMVLLTIAISGGPFLGLLGTVLGVMITFAVIADQGDVNINAIAPGVAAALMTTVAGLFVAIPALFGYNYLSTRIRDMVTEMRVFVDEFIAKVAETHS